MKHKIFCEECSKHSLISDKRDECFDMCDGCYAKLQERIKYMSDRNNRMEITRAATFYASNSNSEELRLRAFFACVMPEYPQHKVEKFLRRSGKYGN